MTDLHPERGLANTLRRALSDAIEAFDFTLEETDGLDAIWIYGYEPRELDRVRELRERHPRCVLLVTSGPHASDWVGEVLSAGADHAMEWPCSVTAVSSLLSIPTRTLTNSN